MDLPSSAYRAPSPPVDAAIGYGPFDGQWSRFAVALFIAATTFGVALFVERSTFRSLACTRPGTCTVEAGGPLLGATRERSFEPDSIVEAKKGRGTGGHARDLLVLVDRAGREAILFDGPRVDADLPAIHDFFVDRRVTSLNVAHPGDPVQAAVLSLLLAAPIVLSLVFLVAGLRTRVRFRVSVLRREGILRIERVGPEGATDTIDATDATSATDIPLSEIVGVDVEQETGAPAGSFYAGPARVIIRRRSAPDLPVSPRFQRGARAHGELVAALRRELGLAASKTPPAA